MQLIKILPLTAYVMFIFSGLVFADELPGNETLLSWISDMKNSELGPFTGFKWFCRDGEILSPAPYACEPHGGGWQHGVWSDDVKLLRENGYYIANIFADLDIAEFRKRPDYKDILEQMIVEQFLMNIDNGWIMRKARYQRGLLHEEDERGGTRRLLFKLAEDPVWLEHGYIPLRVGTRLLPHGSETSLVAFVRQLSDAIAQKDTGFIYLRNKLHTKPDQGDAALIRNYAAEITDPDKSSAYAHLIKAIDEIYSPPNLISKIDDLAGKTAELNDFYNILKSKTKRLEASRSASEQFAGTAELMMILRDNLIVPNGPQFRIMLLELSLVLEDEHFAAGTKLHSKLHNTNRQEMIKWLRHSLDAIYGSGMISRRQYEALMPAFNQIDNSHISCKVYKKNLDYLALVPVWANQRLRYFFGDSQDKFSEIEPLAALFIQDQLRSSPLFFYTIFLDNLIRDADKLNGIRSEFFGENVGAGLRALNPGLASGRLRIYRDRQTNNFDPKGIYFLPQTISELPPIAGILTTDEGNLLSHIQLLARNLGIPNVGIQERLVPKLEQMEGQEVFLAVSNRGSVLLALETGQWLATVGHDEIKQEVVIKPDLTKLNLDLLNYIPLSQLRAEDSGRIVGPKAAKLGELYHLFPGAVAEGLAIPFGFFRQLLDQPYDDSGQSVFEWIVGRHRSFERMPSGSAEKTRAMELFRERLYSRILRTDLGSEFWKKLRSAMDKTFGKDGTYGVFVRSDTNIEDLPGFSGAGLNQTVPHVIGFNNIAEAIRRVWASPFAERAFAWRQARMEQPEHVYTAVLLMRSVPVEKSGVMVTQEIESGDRNWLSVAVNEGVGGAVEGQAAESLRIHITTGEVKLVAQSMASVRKRLNPSGGIDKVSVSGTDRILNPSEIKTLINLAREVPQKFPAIVDAQGHAAPADIEFGFLNGQLMLFQIRPFLSNDRARQSAFLHALDSAGHPNRCMMVNMLAAPSGSLP